MREPVSGRACIVADVNSIKEIVPCALLEMVKNKNYTGLDTLDYDIAKRIRLIPTATALGEGMLVAFRPDGISIGEDKQAKEVDALVALCELKQAGTDYEALVPSEILI